MEQFIFILVSAIVIGSALFVVTSRNLFHSALALMVTFLGVAGLYVMLEAGFLAAAQLLVYIGAISILIIFAIMMTRRLMEATERPFNTQWGLGLVAAVVTMLVLLFVIGSYWPLQPGDGFLQTRTAVSDEVIENSIVVLGETFVRADRLVLAFELASVLLLAALIGAIWVAWPPAEEDER